jgi:hypothetical protein
MPHSLFPRTTAELVARRKQLAPDLHAAFTRFGERVFAAGAHSDSLTRNLHEG